MSDTDAAQAQLYFRKGLEYKHIRKTVQLQNGKKRLFRDVPTYFASET